MLFHSSLLYLTALYGVSKLCMVLILFHIAVMYFTALWVDSQLRIVLQSFELYFTAMFGISQLYF